MNRRRAYDVMLYGGKVIHKSFADEEYIYFDGNNIVTEVGCNYCYIFWHKEELKKGWRKYKEK